MTANTESTDIFFITGIAGFIGFHLAQKLLEDNNIVIGFDNMNSYYDIQLKKARLNILEEYKSFNFIRGDLSEIGKIEDVFQLYSPTHLVNLGAQAGVRYSIDNPSAYMQSNIIGFHNILECCRKYPIRHLVYASSSSVYGSNSKIPFSTEDRTDYPVSFYAATKKSNEVMAYSYSKLYDISSTGLRFFTVYGPYGRPDMAYFLFARKIMEGEPIKIFNNGDMYRDFTYIDDIVQGIASLLDSPPAPDINGAKNVIYNIGNNQPVQLMYFIQTLEKLLGKTATKEFHPMQPGDVYQTYADVSDLVENFDFKPNTPIEEGLKKFVDWFKGYYYEKEK
jgi:UDP-glucuronate 4-epimerase